MCERCLAHSKHSGNDYSDGIIVYIAYRTITVIIVYIAYRTIAVIIVYIAYSTTAVVIVYIAYSTITVIIAYHSAYFDLLRKE